MENYPLNHAEKNYLAKLLSRSKLVELTNRDATCKKIGIDGGELDFGSTSPSSYSTSLVHYLQDIKRLPCLYRLCRLLLSIFGGNEQARIRDLQEKIWLALTLQEQADLKDEFHLLESATPEDAVVLQPWVAPGPEKPKVEVVAPAESRKIPEAQGALLFCHPLDTFPLVRALSLRLARHHQKVQTITHCSGDGNLLQCIRRAPFTFFVFSERWVREDYPFIKDIFQTGNFLVDRHKWFLFIPETLILSKAIQRNIRGFHRITFDSHEIPEAGKLYNVFSRMGILLPKTDYPSLFIKAVMEEIIMRRTKPSLGSQAEKMPKKGKNYLAILYFTEMGKELVNLSSLMGQTSEQITLRNLNDDDFIREMKGHLRNAIEQVDEVQQLIEIGFRAQPDYSLNVQIESPLSRLHNKLLETDQTANRAVINKDAGSINRLRGSLLSISNDMENLREPIDRTSAHFQQVFQMQ